MPPDCTFSWLAAAKPKLPDALALPTTVVDTVTPPPDTERLPPLTTLVRDATPPACTFSWPPLDTVVETAVPPDNVAKAENEALVDQSCHLYVVDTSEPPGRTTRLPATTVVFDASPLVTKRRVPPLDTTLETAAPPDDTVSAPLKKNPPEEPPSSVVDTAVPKTVILPPLTALVFDAIPPDETAKLPPLDTTVETAVPPDDTASWLKNELMPLVLPTSVVDTVEPPADTITKPPTALVFDATPPAETVMLPPLNTVPLRPVLPRVDGLDAAARHGPAQRGTARHHDLGLAATDRDAAQHPAGGGNHRRTGNPKQHRRKPRRGCRG